MELKVSPFRRVAEPSARQDFECSGCCVVLTVPLGARILEMARVCAGSG
jgi:hypothetical protein